MKKSCITIVLILLIFTVSCSGTGSRRGKVKLKTDPKGPLAVGVMVVPRGHKHFAVKALIAQGPGTGIAWERDKGRIDLGEFKLQALGFDLADRDSEEAKVAGFSEEKVARYQKELKALGVKSTFISSLGFYPLDADALVTWSKLDLKTYMPVQLKLVGETKDKMIHVYKIERDLSRP